MVEQSRVSVDPRTSAFCSNSGPTIFGSVAYPNEVWTPDPLDVETVHGDARNTFSRLVNTVTAPDHNSAGKVLLLRGQSGSGKTHLMRAFRNDVHRRGLAYFTYMQMTTELDYSRYLLNKFVESMEQAYYLPRSDDTGLMRLSQALVELPVISPEQREHLGEELDDETRVDLIEELADKIVDNYPEWRVELDLVRAVLLLQCPQPSIYRRVIKWLRAEELSENDRRKLGGLSPNPGAYRWRLEGLGRLMACVHRAGGQAVALIICADQFEDFFRDDNENSRRRFNHAITELNSLAEHLPNSIILISCLEGYYAAMRDSMDRSLLFRLENNPAPLVLEAKRSPEECQLIVASHLSHLYDQVGVEIDPSNQIFPIPPLQFSENDFHTTRELLKWCHDYREKCILAGELVEVDKESSGISPVLPPVEPDLNVQIEKLEQAWNDELIATLNPPESATEQASLLTEAIQFCNDELNTGHQFQVEQEDRFLTISRETRSEVEEWMLAGICNRAPQGGVLGKEVSEVESMANNQTHDTTPVILRSKDFPKTASSKIGIQLGKLVARGGRRVQVSDSDWRAMLTMRSFRQEKAGDGFHQWLAASRPLSHLKSLRELLGLDGLKPVAKSTEKTPPDFQSGGQASMKQSENDQPETEVATDKQEQKAPPEPTNRTSDDLLRVGLTRGTIKQEIITIGRNQLKTHAAFIGGTGSGKTTAALNLLEQLLLRDTPVILVDRKGDLCAYADPDQFADQHNELDTRRQALLAKLDVAVYTPGSTEGRPLALPILPMDIKEASTSERETITEQAARGLGSMMNLKTSQTDQECVAILRLALDLLADQVGPPSLEQVLDFVGSEDPLLLNRMGYLNQSRLARLTSCLQTMVHSPSSRRLFEGDESLDVDRLLGRGVFATPGKTRLSVISTKFLGETVDMQFWVAQLLLEIRRWMSRNPADNLQAVIMIDEADIYLPANSKPVSKEPMEDLLKRARSAGLGVFLATQNPGDFDYKCRENLHTWFIGKIKEANSMTKLKEMLAECKQNVSGQLASQTVGQFYLVRGQDVVPIQSDRSGIETRQLAEQEILNLAKRV